MSDEQRFHAATGDGQTSWPELSAGGFADACPSDGQSFHAAPEGEQAASQPRPAKPARTQTKEKAKFGQAANPNSYRNLAPREGCGPLCQIYTRLICYLSALVCSAVIAIELEMIQNSDNLNGVAACPFELTKLDCDAGDQTKCRYVELISWSGMAVAGLFLIATTCYACYKRVRPNKLILFEVALTVIMFILQLAGSLVIILGFNDFCDTFTQPGQSCEDSTLSADPKALDAGTRDGFDNIYARLRAMSNSAYALIAIWGLLTAILAWRTWRVLGSCRPLSTYQKKDKRYPHVHLAGRNHPDPYDDFAYNEQGQSGNDSLHEKLLR